MLLLLYVLNQSSSINLLPFAHIAWYLGLTDNLDGRLNPSKLQMVSADWKTQMYARPKFVSAPQHLCLFVIYTLNLGVSLETAQLLSASKTTGHYHFVLCVSSQYFKQFSWKRMLCSVMFSLFKSKQWQKPPNLCKCKMWLEYQNHTLPKTF